MPSIDPDDTDLADLLGPDRPIPTAVGSHTNNKGPTTSQRRTTTPSSAVSPSSMGAGMNHTEMNLDHLTKKPISVMNPTTYNGGSSSPTHPRNGTFALTGIHHGNGGRGWVGCGCCRFLGSCLSWWLSYISFTCQYYPTFCGIVAILVALAIMIGVILFAVYVVFNPRVQMGLIDDHHLDIVSKYDLTLSQVDHWCLRGAGDDTCTCDDPLVPLARDEHLSWTVGVRKNQELIQQLLRQQKAVSSASRVAGTGPQRSPDVAILGESVVEAMSGRWMGQTRSPGMVQLQTMFQNSFQQPNSTITGVALGMAGDACPNVLWRLMHTELPAGFEPRVWWLSLGMNDLARMECSEEIVFLGILRIVEELMEKRPGAMIVINSLLPMVDIRGGAYPYLSDYEQAFVPAKLRQQQQQQENDDEYNHRHLRVFGREKRDDTESESSQFHPVTEEEANIEKIERKREKEEVQRRRRRRRPDAGPVTLNDHKTMKQYMLGRKERRSKRIPLWTSIKAINQELAKFCDHQQAKHHKRVYFCDTTDIFVENVRHRDRIRSGRITLMGYPRPRGFKLWGERIISFTKELLEKYGNEPHDNNVEGNNEHHSEDSWDFGAEDIGIDSDDEEETDEENEDENR